MEHVIILLKNEKDKVLLDDNLSPFTKAFVMNSLDEAINLLTFQRYCKDIIMSENEEMRALLKENNIAYEFHKDRYLAELILPDLRKGRNIEKKSE